MRRVRDKNRSPKGWTDGALKTMVEKEFGKYAGKNRPHEFWRFGSICFLCFGDVEHVSHWLPKEIQDLFDKRVFESEDEKMLSGVLR